MGHEVTAFALRPTDSDRALLHELGVSTIIDTADPVGLKSAKERVDFILPTVHGSIDFKPFVAALRQNGRLVLVGNTPDPIGDVVKHLMLGQREYQT
jgi:D-arabinose 1-dehydrogenase-like Zn-dependent alcohol dehydrogenase